jgi:hypothetical protein
VTGNDDRQQKFLALCLEVNVKSLQRDMASKQTTPGILVCCSDFTSVSRVFGSFSGTEYNVVHSRLIAVPTTSFKAGSNQAYQNRTKERSS